MNDQQQQFKALIAEAAAGSSLSFEKAKEAFSLMMSGETTQAQIGGFLMALRVRGETVDEISAGATVMRERMVHVKAPRGRD